MEISTRMINNILAEMGLPESTNQGVARIPGKRTVIISSNAVLKDKAVRNEIAKKIGNNEEVLTISINKSVPIWRQFNQLCEIFHSSLRDPKIHTIQYLGEPQTLAYCTPVLSLEKEKDNIILIEQIMHLQVVFRN